MSKNDTSCEVCDGGLPIDEVIADNRQKVAEYGWTGIHVFDASPPFTYTIGFNDIDRPDVIMFGLPPQSAHGIFTLVYESFVKDKAVISPHTLVSNYSNMPTAVVPVTDAAKSEYCAQSFNYYENNDFDMVQLVWPDPAGLFPWDAEFDPNLTEYQLVLGEWKPSNS